MTENLVATASATAEASPEEVWRAITDPAAIQRFMFGTRVVTNWKVGSPIVWRGEWKGKPYEDHGIVEEMLPRERLRVTHFSPLSGQEDRPENYHNVTWSLEADGPKTRITLEQDGNPTAEAQEHSRANWQSMLDQLVDYLEG